MGAQVCLQGTLVEMVVLHMDGQQDEKIKIWFNGWWGMIDVICTLVTLRQRKRILICFLSPLALWVRPWQRVVNGRLSFHIFRCTPLQWLTDLRHIYLKILSSGHDWLAVDWSSDEVCKRTEHMRDMETNSTDYNLSLSFSDTHTYRQQKKIISPYIHQLWCIKPLWGGLILKSILMQ